MKSSVSDQAKKNAHVFAQYLTFHRALVFLLAEFLRPNRPRGFFIPRLAVFFFLIQPSQSKIPARPTAYEKEAPLCSRAQQAHPPLQR